MDVWINGQTDTCVDGRVGGGMYRRVDRDLGKMMDIRMNIRLSGRENE
jgi:hypothetical protein